MRLPPRGVRAVSGAGHGTTATSAGCTVCAGEARGAELAHHPNLFLFLVRLSGRLGPSYFMFVVGPDPNLNFVFQVVR